MNPTFTYFTLSKSQQSALRERKAAHVEAETDETTMDVQP